MKKDTIKILFCIAVIAFISFMGIFTITNNNTYSQYEGRSLVTFPRPKLNEFLNDDIYETITNAFSDQMFIKNIFVKLYHKINFQRYIDDVVIGKDEQLFYQPFIVEDEEEYIDSLKNVISNEMNEVAEGVNKLGAEFIFISIPRKDVAMNNYLPFSYYDGTGDYLKYVEIIKDVKSDNVNFIDSYHLFNESKYNSFYQTDHHVNIRGGYLLFEEIINIVNKKHKVKIDSLENEYDIFKQVVNGSYNRKTGNAISSEPEELNLNYKKSDVKYVRSDNGQLSSVAVFGSGTSYASAYMGNDYGETIIDTNLDKAPNILYVGTSYTNVLESLSVFKFNKMVSIDYRHNETGKSIEDYVKEYNIDYVVFICSQSDNALKVSSIKQQLGK